MSSPQESGRQDDWAVSAAELSEDAFRSGRVGPFLLGPSVRRTAFGEVIVGLHRESREVVEIDLYDALLGTPFASPESPLMSDLAQVSSLRHKHIASIVGAGFDEGVPWVRWTVRGPRTALVVEPASELVFEATEPGAYYVTYEVGQKLAFLGESEVIRISALTGKNVHRLLPALAEAISAYHRRVPTRKVNEVVSLAQSAQPAPHGGRILYATQGATDPPTFTLFANKELPATYLRYIERKLREAFDLGATPIKLRVRQRSN